MLKRIKQNILDWIVYHYIRSWYWYNVIRKLDHFREEVQCCISAGRDKNYIYDLIHKPRYRWLSKSYMKKIINEIL